MVDPERQRDVEEQQQRPHPQVDARTRESRVQDRKRDPRRREASTGGDVPRASIRQVAEDRVRRDLGAKDLEKGREGEEVLAESNDGANDTAFRQLLEEERQEGCENERGQPELHEPAKEPRDGPMKKTIKIEMMQRLIQS